MLSSTSRNAHSVSAASYSNGTGNGSVFLLTIAHKITRPMNVVFDAKGLVGE